MVSVSISKLGLTDLIFVDLAGGEDQRPLLQQRAPVTAAVMCDLP